MNKRTTASCKPNVYFAGKIGKNDWRHGLVPALRGHDWGDCAIDTEAYRYVGPFFVSCDHGCNHNPHGHGAVRMSNAGPLSARTVAHDGRN